VKLHLGCGKRFIPGFYHIDALPYPHVDKVGSVDDLKGINSESINLIYACHVLEHFPRNSAKQVIKEWHRVLKRDSILRIAVPDFEAICSVYLKNHNIEEIIGPVCGKQDHEHNFHYVIYDFDSLSSLLKTCGFREVNRYDWRNTEHSEVDDFSQAYIPHMNKTSGTLISLNVEAIK
tara:strand:- start:56 stop:586 length:531 start_codon:yes stop_codon:yes gene_type:complete